MWDRISTSHMQEHHRAAKGAWICFLRTSKSLLLPPGQRLSKGQLLPQNVPGTPFPLSLNRDHASKYCKLLQRYFMVFGIQLLLCLACLAFRHSEGTHQRIRCHHHLCPALGQSTFLILFEGWNPTARRTWPTSQQLQGPQFSGACSHHLESLENPGSPTWTAPTQGQFGISIRWDSVSAGRVLAASWRHWALGTLHFNVHSPYCITETHWNNGGTRQKRAGRKSNIMKNINHKTRMNLYPIPVPPWCSPWFWFWRPG